MRRLLVGAILAFAALVVHAQSAVIRAETAAGVYTNLKSSTAQALDVFVAQNNSAGTNADAMSGAWGGAVVNWAHLYNGSTWDSWRGSTLTNGTGIAKVTIAGVGDPCLSSETSKSSAIIGISTAATTALVAPSGSTTVYVCDFVFSISQVVTTANTLKFVQGTGAACATGQSDLTGLFGAGGVTAGIPIVVSAASSGSVLKTAASGGLCAVTAIGASAAFAGVLTYVQQ